MTLLFSRKGIEGPATHAFVIGVGGYPYAKPGKGYLSDLEAEDLPSAADSARFFCDWLLRNRDNLAAPLASIEILITDTPRGEVRYDWAPDLGAGRAMPKSIENATSSNLARAGQRWLNRATRRAGDNVILYCCGHGASLKTEPVLFLSDLNKSSINPWACVNLRRLGSALCKYSAIAGAAIFVDACAEALRDFNLADALDTRFWDAHPYGTPEIPKALLIGAAADGLLAYDGQAPGSEVRLGRFTQTLVKALDGSAVERMRTGWAVTSTTLRDNLTGLRDFHFPRWNDKPFVPVALMGPNEVVPIVSPVDPRVPVLARTNPPSAMRSLAFCISDTPPPPPAGRQDIAPDPHQDTWRCTVPATTHQAYAIAYRADEHHFVSFTPDRPCFDLQVDIA